MRARPRSEPARPSQPAEPRWTAAGLQQHDLKRASAEVVIAGCDIARGERVLEIGPGMGALTASMLARGAEVHAVELDPARASALESAFASAIAEGRLHLQRGDARALRVRFAGDWRVVANPPFQITAEVVRRWILAPSGAPPARIDLVLQLETARKLCGEPRAETRSSVLMRLFGAPRIVRRLQRSDVTPPSRVDLCHFACTRTRDTVPPEELARVDRLLVLGFAGPHSVSQALRGCATAVQLKRQAAEHRWHPDDHPRTLSAPAWRSLADILARCGKI